MDNIWGYEIYLIIILYILILPIIALIAKRMIAPDGKPGWKRQCTNCKKEIATQNEYFNWQTTQCIDCFSMSIAKMCTENSELRMLEENEEYVLAWVFSPVISYVNPISSASIED